MRFFFSSQLKQYLDFLNTHFREHFNPIHSILKYNFKKLVKHKMDGET